MAEEGFKLPASSYEELTKIIMGYGKSKDPISPGEISHLTGQNADNISKNNPFLVIIGLVEGGKKKVATSPGYALARALEHEMPDEITKNWHEVVSGNFFFQKILSAIKIRKGMDVPTLQAHVAYSAGQPKNPRTMAGAKTVIDILRASEVIVEKDGKYTITSEGPSWVEANGISDPPLSEKQNKKAIEPQRRVNIPGSADSGTQVGVSIQIQIRCSASDVDGLGVKLKKLLQDLSVQSSVCGEEKSSKSASAESRATSNDLVEETQEKVAASEEDGDFGEGEPHTSLETHSVEPSE